MPIYQHGDFYREVRDVPPELEPLAPLINSGYNGPRAGCSCDECRTMLQFTEEQRDEATRILREQAQAQADLSAYILRTERCRRCGYAMRGGNQVATAEGPVLLCRYCEPSTHWCTRCDLPTLEGMILHGSIIWCRGCAVDLSECWCGLLYDPEYDDPCPQPPGQIHGYNYRPTPVFYALGDGTDTRLESKQGQVRNLTPYMGFELEVSFAYARSGREAAAGTVTDIIGNVAYLKEDGSIDSGFEMVTHPMTLEYAIHRFPWNVLAAMDSAGGEVHEGLGLHVHVSKAAFESPSHEYRWLLFWHRNYRVMRRLARRDSQEWAAWSPNARAAAKRIAKKETDGREFGRYQAINTINEHTHEVRIFQSSLVPEEVIASLALVSGTVEYCRELDSNGVLKASGWEFATFAAWAEKRPIYAALTEEIRRRFPQGFTAAFGSSRGPRPARSVPQEPRRRVTTDHVGTEEDWVPQQWLTAAQNYRAYAQDFSLTSDTL